MILDALLLTCTDLLLRAVGLAFQAYTASVLGAAGVGLLRLIMTVGVLFGTVGSSGIRVAAMVLCAQEFGHRRAGGVRSAIRCCVCYGLIVSTFAAVLLYFFSDTAARFLVQDPRAVLGLRITAVFLPATVLSSVMSGYFTACGKVRALAFTQLAERLTAVGVTLLLLLLRHDAAWVCAAIVGGSGIASVCSFIALFARYRKDCQASDRAGVPMAKRLFSLCVPLAVGDYMRQGLSAVEQFLIPYGLAKCADREAAMATYGTLIGMAFPVVMFPAALIWSAADLLVPALSRCMAIGNTRRILALTDRCFRLGSVFAAAVAGVLWLSADTIGDLLYQSAEAGRAIRLFAPMVLFLYLDNVVDGMHKGLGQQVACVRYNTFTNVLDVIGLYTLLPRFGVAGYLFTYAVSHLVNFFLSIRRLLQVTGCCPSVKRLIALLGLLLACAGVSLLLPEGLRAVVYLPIFLFLCCKTKLISREDRLWLRSAVCLQKKHKQAA